MATNITSTLLAMLPTYTLATLPQALIDTATALLAQSRSRASSLKQEEQIARSCVCAEIACRRLQTRLNLPTISARPPCPPRVYKKLYQYLDKALVTPSTTKPTSTPTKSRSAYPVTKPPTTPSKIPTHPLQNGPTTPNTHGQSKKRKLDDPTIDIPPWIAPTIRHLCKKFDAPAAVPHIYVGVVSILRQGPMPILASPAKPRPGLPMAAGKDDNGVLALIVAVMLLVLQKVEVRDDDMGTDEDVTARSRQAAKELVALGRVNVRRAGEVVAAVERLVEEEWAEWRGMEWWGNVPDVSAPSRTEQSGGEMDVDGDAEEMEEEAARPSQRVGERDAGGVAMGMGAVDWLSDARRRDYAVWKAGIMKEVSRIERETGVA